MVDDRSDTIQHRSYIEKSSDGSSDFKYKCEFLVGHFAPNDFKIKLRGSQLTVEATHQTGPEKTPQQLDLENFYYDNDATYALGSLGKKSEKFVREIEVPKFVDTDSLICYLETYEDFQNVLVVEGAVDRRYVDADPTLLAPVAKNPQVASSRNAKNDLRIESSSTMSSSKIYASNPNVRGRV